MVNEFFKYGRFEVRDELLMILKMSFECGEPSSSCRKTVIKHSLRKVIRVSVLYSSISFVPVRSKLLSITSSSRLSNNVYKVLEEEHCCFRIERRKTVQISILRFKFEKVLSRQTLLALSSTDYEHVFDSADRGALAKSHPCMILSKKTNNFFNGK